MKKFSKGPKIGIEVFSINGAITGSRLFLSDTFSLIGSLIEEWIESYLAGAPLPLDLYCDHSKNVNLSRRRLEFEPGAAGAEAAKLKKFSDASGLEFNGCPTLADSHFLSGRSINAGTPYQQKAMRAMQQIPFGETISYAELASLIGNPKGARAAGNACNRNPFPLLVPCHRVVHKNRSIGGFAFDLEIKRRLLEFEAGMTPPR